MKNNLSIPISAYITLDGLSGHKDSHLDEKQLKKALLYYRDQTLHNILQYEFGIGNFVVENGYIFRDDGGYGHNGWDTDWVKLRQATREEDRLWNDVGYMIDKMEEYYED